VKRTLGFLLSLAGACGPVPATPDADAGASWDAARPDVPTFGFDAGGADAAPRRDAGPFDAGPVAFEEVGAAAGFDHNQDAPPAECTGATGRFGCVGARQTGGAAVADVNEDGWPDLYFPVLDGPDALYINQGDGTFVDEADARGLGDAVASNAAAFADVDGDGDLDLFVSSYGGHAHRLYINEDGRFRDEASERGVALTTRSRPLQGTGASFADFDRDGWLDLFVGEWIDAADLELEAADATGLRSKARLLRNMGGEGAPGFFEDVTTAAGLDLESLSDKGVYPFGATFADLDDDGWLDMAVAGDFFTSRLYWNNADGTFTDGTSAAGVGTDSNGMASAIADVDADGDLDWLITSISSEPPTFTAIEGNRLYLNQGGRRFVDAADAWGVRATDWSWGVVFLDHDNDRDLDVMITNGFWDDARTRFFVHERDYLFEAGRELGIAPRGQGRSLVTLDYDGDGDLDIALARSEDVPLLYRNLVGATRPAVRVILRQPGRPNAFAVGAKVWARPATGPSMIGEVRVGAQYVGQSEEVLHFGLGDESACPLAELEIRWPDGARQIEESVPCGLVTTIRRAD